jgi:hypothetical protein
VRSTGKWESLVEKAEKGCVKINDKGLWIPAKAGMTRV